LSLYLIITTIAGLVCYSIFYIIFSLRKQGSKSYFLLSVFTIVYLNILWYVNDQGNGPILSLMVVCYLFILLVPQKMHLKFIASLAFLNLLVLFLVDIYFPSELGKYPDTVSRLVDIYTIAFFSTLLLLAMVSVFKKYYLKEMVRAQESDKLKSAFLANLSHEIRTPLNAIIGFSSIIAEESGDPEKMEFARMVQENGNQLSSLVDKLMILSKIESGNIALNPTEFELRVVFDKLLKEFTLQANQKQLGFEYRIKGCLTFSTDMKMLTLVLTEMLSNAMKFSKKGKIRFGAIYKTGQCIFFVKDFGIGIRDENVEKIFDRFIKIDEYTSVMVRGVGIGLCLSKKVVEQLGGHIKVKSTYKKGSVFYFTIPAL
jgi:signal transduction histidine kinase